MKRANAEALHRSGVEKYERGDLRGALRDYTRSIRLRPRAAAYNDRGIVRKAMGNWKGALADYVAAIKADARYWQAWSNLGTYLSQREEYEGALQAYSRALRIRPREAQLYCFRANARGCLMDYAGALQDYTRAILLDPRMGQAYFVRGATRQILATLTGAGGEVTVLAGESKRTYAPASRQSRRHLQAALSDFDKAEKWTPGDAWYLERIPALRREIRQQLRKLKQKPRAP